jgi:hypothetical protein
MIEELNPVCSVFVGKTLQVVVVVTTLFIEIEKGNPDIPRDVCVSGQQGTRSLCLLYTLL